jgi:LysM repeat protein
VQPGEILAKIAYRHGVSLYALSAANGIWNQDLILVGQQLVLPGCKGGHSASPIGAYPSETHIVQPGETLSELAVWYGVTFDQMMAANGLRNPNKIYVGQQLIIP